MKIGDIVISVFGHDIGEWYVVSQVCDNYAYLVDGKNRPLSKPKKKKVKHIIKANFFADEIAKKLISKELILDAEVRKTLNFFKKQN